MIVILIYLFILLLPLLLQLVLLQLVLLLQPVEEARKSKKNQLK
jgi:hypothetical protein